MPENRERAEVLLGELNRLTAGYHFGKYHLADIRHPSLLVRGYIVSADIKTWSGIADFLAGIISGVKLTRGIIANVKSAKRKDNDSNGNSNSN